MKQIFVSKSKSAVLFAVMCLIFMLTVSTNCFAYAPNDPYTTYDTSGNCGANATWTLNTETWELVITGTGTIQNGYPCFPQMYVESVVIGEGVTGIENMTFMSGEQIESVKLPSTLKYIGSNAFSGCKKLTNINIPSGVTLIDRNAFVDCKSLKSLELPESVTTIGTYAFGGCESLTSINIPSKITTLSDYVFKACDFTEFRIPDTVTSIGNYAFSSCKNLKSVTLPKGIKEIPGGAFSGCPYLTSVSCPVGVTKIGSSAFSGCKSLKTFAIPSAVTEIGEHAFNECTALTAIEIPTNVKEIKEYAFYSCSALTSVKFPEGLTTIGDYSFYGCKSLKAVTIPKKVTSISDSAFWDCGKPLTISGYAGTAAQTYADSHDSQEFIFKEIGTTGGAVQYKNQKYTVTVKKPKLTAGKTTTLTIDGLKENPKVTYQDKWGDTYNYLSVQKTGANTAKISAKKTGKATFDIRIPVTTHYYASRYPVTITILPTATPVKTVMSTKKGTMTVRWNANSTTDWYQIQYSTKKNFQKNATKTVLVKKQRTTQKQIKKLTSNKKYFVRMRSIDKTKKLYSSWSKAKTVRVK